MRINIVHMGFFYSGGGEGLLSQEGRDSADSEIFPRGFGSLRTGRIGYRETNSEETVQ